MSRRYDIPFLTIIMNNQGWNATQENYKLLHPQGGSENLAKFVNLGPSADFAKVAEATGGALALTIERADELAAALKTAMDAVKSGRAAVVDVRMRVL